MIHSHGHFRQTIAVEAMRLMDEEPLSLDQAIEKAQAAFADVQGYEPPVRDELLAVAVPSDTD